jgi:hypothetical protein
MTQRSSFAPPHASASPRSGSPNERDAYADLLRDTRGLKREQAQQREQWFSQLPFDHKEELLFELEILLKGLACFANPRNHPGPPRRTPVVAQDFREPLALSREAIGRIAMLSRSLLVDREKAFVFQRYLETVLPDDRARQKLVTENLSQGSPAESLFVMRHAMTNLLEVASGISRLPRVPFRLFYALMGVAQREVVQSAYFNPLSALEFRPEFDRITNVRILELTRSIPGEDARRIVALTFLSLFRMLRYLALLEATTRDGTDTRNEARRTMGVAYFVLSVLRSDARALTDYLRHRAGPLLAEGYERDLFSVPAAQIGERYEHLLERGHRLLDIKATLEGLSANLRLELRRAFEHDFLPPESNATFETMRASLVVGIANLRPALQNAILFLARSLGAAPLEEQTVFDDAEARRRLSERLRRDVWMFAQIVRAFAHKARAVHAGEIKWTGVSPLQFVHEFLSYFRAMGYPLLRAADYPRVNAFVSAMTSLEETDLLEPSRLEKAIGEAEQFQEFLSALFESIGRRDELQGVAFDRRAAAEALKLYLGR